MVFRLIVFLCFLFCSLTKSYANCTAPDGSPVQTGDSVTLFKSKYKPAGSDCESVERVCLNNGELSRDPAARYVACLNEKTCTPPYGEEPLTDGQSVVAFKTSNAPCIQETRVCNGKTGVLSGSYLHNFCKD